MKALLPLVGTISALANSFGQTPTGPQLAEELDRIRRPTKAFEVRMTLTELRDGKAQKTAEFQIYTRKSSGRDDFDAVTLCLAPEADRGKTVLTKDREIWLYDPKSKRPVAISPAQFRGKFFVGDALSTAYAADYESEYAGEETVANAGRKERPCHHIRMKLRRKGGLTPETIEYWIDRENGQPVRSHFYSANGKLLRTAYYSEYTKVLGATRPMRILVVSGVERGLVTDIHFSQLALRDSPERMFNTENLPLVAAGKLP